MNSQEQIKLDAEQARVKLQRIYDDPQGPMEENLKDKVLSNGSQPHEWGDITVRLMMLVSHYFSMGWDSKKC